MLSSLRKYSILSVSTLLGWAASASPALGIDIGEVPPGLGGTTNVQDSVTEIVIEILSYMALVATIVIIIAGVRMVISSGDDTGVEKAKKTLLWALAGLIVILLAGAIVSVVANIF